MDRIILPQDNSNESSNVSHRFVNSNSMGMDVGYDFSREQYIRLDYRRDTPSSIGPNGLDNEMSNGINRKRKKDDKIPFTPDVS